MRLLAGCLTSSWLCDDGQVEAELKKLEDDRKKQVQEMERFEAERKRMEEDKEKHKADLAKLELERKKEEETRLKQQKQFEEDMKRLEAEKARIEVRRCQPGSKAGAMGLRGCRSAEAVLWAGRVTVNNNVDALMLAGTRLVVRQGRTRWQACLWTNNAVVQRFLFCLMMCGGLTQLSLIQRASP